MSNGLTLCGTLLILAALALAGSYRIRSAVIVFGLQSLILALTGSLVAAQTGFDDIYVIALLTLIIKVGVIPLILLRTLGRSADSEVGSTCGPGLSLGIAVLLLIAAHRFSWPHLASSLPGPWLATAICLAVIGLFLMVDRRHAVAQVLGFLTLENGIFLAAMSITYGMPFVVEIGVFFDLLVAVLLMATLVYRMHDSLATLDTGKLRRLRG